MAKAPTFDTITAGYASATVYNANNAATVTAFDNTVSRDGSTPNTMLADFDMNSNDILNANIVNAVDIVVAGTSISAQVTAAAASAAAAAVSETNAAASAALAATLTTFLALSDTPSTYAGSGGLFAKVNAGATALEFVAGSGSEPSDGDKGDITVATSGTVWTIDAGVVDTTELATDAVTAVKITDGNVTFAKIAAAATTGSDNLLVSGTAGTTNYTAKWDANGDLIDGFEVLDEDNLVSDSATKLVTQQSVKAYIDAASAGGGSGWTLQETMYDFTVDGAISSFESSTLVDGQEYALYFEDLSPQSSSGKTFGIEIYKATDAAYHPDKKVLTVANGAGSNSYYGWVEFKFLRDSIAYKIASGATIKTTGGATDPTADDSWIVGDNGDGNSLRVDLGWTLATAQKVGKLRVSVSGSTIDQGRVLLYKRPV